MSLTLTVEEVRARATGEDVRFGGRAILSADAEVVVWDATGSLPVRLPAGLAFHPAPGDLLRVVGRRSARGVDAIEVERAHAAGSRALAQSGEVSSLSGGEPSRADRLRARSRIFAQIRSFFDEAGFLEVDTPLAVPSPGLDPHLSAFEARGLGYLITSPEMHLKRLVAGGLPRIFQLGKCFRADEAGPLHRPEFTLLEWYRAFEGAEAVMADTEALVSRVATLENGAPFLVMPSGARVEVEPPYPRMSVSEAFELWAGVSLEAILPDEERFFRLWVERVEPHLGEGRPLFVNRWPASMASLAKLCDDDPRYAERFELYVGGVELCNGFDELTDAEEQRRRFEADQKARRKAGLPVYPIDERFLAALAAGMPPSGGNALGVDRLILLATGAADLGEVLPFDDL